jgi:hypothetical protein
MLAGAADRGDYAKPNALLAAMDDTGDHDHDHPQTLKTLESESGFTNRVQRKDLLFEGL